MKQHSQTYEDEIDLADLIRSLWKGKWLVIGVTSITLIIALAYLAWVPKTYMASLEISPLSSIEADTYTELNATELMLVDEQVLLSLFTEDMQSYNGIQESIKSNHHLKQQKDETDREYTLRVGAAGYNFSIVTSGTSVILHITTKDPDFASVIVAEALELSNQNVNDQLANIFYQSSEEHARRNRLAIEDLDLRKQRALSLYHLGLAAKLATLAEQAQIAREIELSYGSFSGQAYTGDATVIGSFAKDSPIYLRGYLAIEKEIEVLKSRKAAAPFVTSLPAIEEAKLTLLQDQTIARANEVFAKTPIGTDRFTAAAYNVALVEYKTKTKTSLILALALVLGGMLGVLVLLIRNVLINKD